MKGKGERKITKEKRDSSAMLDSALETLPDVLAIRLDFSTVIIIILTISLNC